MNDLVADEDMGIFPVTRLDGKIDKSAPRYIAVATPFYRRVNRGPDLVVQISDLGSGKTSARLGVVDKMSLTIG